MKYLINFLLLVGLLTFNGCKEKGSFEFPTTTLSFSNFDNLESMTINNEQNVTTHLLGYDALGNVKEISNLSVVEYRSIENGIYVVVSEVHNIEGSEEIVLPGAKYFVEPSGRYHAILTSGNFVGETNEKKIVFSNADMYNTISLNLQGLNTNLDLPSVTGLSGNFMTLQNTSGSITQVLDSLTDVRYNINPSTILSLNQKEVLMTNLLLDITTQTINTTANTGNIGIENIAQRNALPALVIAPTQNNVACPVAGKSCVYSFEVNASSSIVGASGYDISTSTSDGIENEVLFTDENYIIVKELSHVSIIERVDFNVSTALNNLNLGTISYKNGKIFFVAEDNRGVRKNGKYNIALGTTKYYTKGLSTLAKLKAIN